MLLDLIELASNRTLAYDHATLERLERLQGKSMVLTVKPIDQSLAITPQKEGLEFSSRLPDHVDVTLRATLNALVKISRHGMDRAELEPGELEIEGDPIIGQRFALVIAELDIDWNDLLTDQLGDAPAQFIQMATGQAFEFASSARQQLKSTARRILTQDFDLVTNPAEVEEVLDQIDDVRADVDRLWIRLNRLSQASESNNPKTA